MDTSKSTFDAIFKDFVIDFKTINSKKENIYINRPAKGKSLYAFEHENMTYVLYDDRKTGHNNFVLRIILKNSKKIIICGVDKIISYLKKKDIPQQYYYKIEQLLMEEVI